MLGSPYYLSPEQLSGLPVGPASDLFSLGTLTYELFTGVRPFEADYPAAIQAGATHVRVGSAIFGARQPKA